MTLAGLLTLAVIALMTGVIARGRLGPDLAMFSALCVVVVAGVVDPMEALRGFANPAIVTIGMLFVVAAAVVETGALRMLSQLVLGKTTSPGAGFVRMVVPTALSSGFLNNTPIVAMLIPVARDFGKRVGAQPSAFLMPIAFASMLGGTCTLIGTSSNLVVSGLLSSREGGTELGMLEISWVGVPTMVVGVLYLVTVGRRLLQDRRAPEDALTDDPKEYLAEVEVQADSPLVGKDIEDAGLRHLPQLFLAEIRRTNGQIVRPVAPRDRVEAGDHLVFSGVSSSVKDLRTLPGLRPLHEPDLARDTELFEVVISHRSRLVGRTVKEVEFRRRYDAAILAVHRSGERIRQKIGDIVLRPGDTLMLSASDGFADTFRDHPGFYLVSAVSSDTPPRYHLANLTLAVVAALVIVPAVTGLPMLVAAMAATVVLLAAGCVTPRRARQSVEWSVLLVIGSALGLAAALDASGAAKALGEGLAALTGVLGPHGVLAGVYVLGVLAASLLTNAAAAALVFPIAMTAATAAQIDSRPVAIAVAMAASAAFATPVGSNPILLVAGPGGYRYRDFLRVGLPLNLLCLIVVLTILPMVWPLQPAAP